MEPGNLGTETADIIITISLYRLELLGGPDSKTNSVLAGFVRELDGLELGGQIL